MGTRGGGGGRRSFLTWEGYRGICALYNFDYYFYVIPRGLEIRTLKQFDESSNPQGLDEGNVLVRQPTGHLVLISHKYKMRKSYGLEQISIEVGNK